MSHRRSRYVPPAWESRAADDVPWVHDFDLEDVVACAVAYRSRFVMRKHFGVCFEASVGALRERHPGMPERDARVAAFRIISAATREHSAFFRYDIRPGEELWPAGWYVDDVKVDQAEQRARADELRQQIQTRLGKHA
jgi:hypothetical protein